MSEKKHSNLKRVLIIAVCLVLLVTSSTALQYKNGVSADKKNYAKNVIMLIPDGTSVEEITLARWYNGGQNLAMDEIAVGLTRTYWKGGPITDSAPGGTAYAIGYKTSDGHVGVLSDEEASRPVANIIEAARLSGKATGIIATSEVMHATPADFSAHDPDRNNYNSLMKQEVYSGIDVVLGGGDEFFSQTAGGKRSDKQDLRDTIRSLGYDYVTTKDEMSASKSRKLWGAFAPKDMAYDIDRQNTANSTQPSLEEMTKKAIDVLSKDKDGFVLMVEGSKVDWAAHANDPVGVVTDLAAFDKAVKAALDFARKDGHTVVVVSADHGTGGMAIGSNAQSHTYSTVSFENSVDKLKPAKATAETASKAITLNSTDQQIIKLFADDYAINLTAEELKTIIDTRAKAIAADANLTDAALAPIMAPVIAQIVSAEANVGWVYGGHVGGDVALFNYAPWGIESLHGVVQNSDVGRYLARVLGLNTDNTTKELFVNAKSAFEALGAQVTIDASDVDNPKLVVTKGQSIMTLPGYTNKAQLNGKEYKLDGVNICEKVSGKYDVKDAYVSQKAVELFKNSLKSNK